MLVATICLIARGDEATVLLVYSCFTTWDCRHNTGTPYGLEYSTTIHIIHIHACDCVHRTNFAHTPTQSNGQSSEQTDPPRLETVNMQGEENVLPT